MNTGRVDAIGNDDRAYKPQYQTGVKKKNPWDYIGNVMTSIGSINLPCNFNSAFTVGKGGGETSGLARG